MKCTRCHGVMLKERQYDLLENDGQFYPSGWEWAYRCVACGTTSRWLVEQNRDVERKAVTADERGRNSEEGAASAMTQAPTSGWIDQ